MNPAKPRRSHPHARKAVNHLKKADPRLAKLIARVGPVRIEIDPNRTLFDALLRSIVYQQLHGKAAATILGRVQAHFSVLGGPIDPRHLVRAADEELRALGLSRNKAAAIRDLSEKQLAGAIPDLDRAREMTDDELIAALTEVRGVGRWTVQMILIFTLGRPDVLPLLDFGVKKGYALHYGKRAFPTDAALEKHGELWRPYRSIASWYMWRATELEEYREAGKKVRTKPVTRKKKAAKKKPKRRT